MVYSPAPSQTARRCPKQFPAALLLAAAAVPVGTVALAARPARAGALPAGYALIFEDNFDSPDTLDPTGGGGGGGGGGGDTDTFTDSTLDGAGNTNSLGRDAGLTAPNGAKWQNWQPNVYRRDAFNDPNAASIADGRLTVKTWSEVNDSGNLVHHTGMISTQGLFEHAYGRYEASIDFNDSPGQWSAFWLYQDAISNDPSPTGETGVELDIMEHRARDSGDNDIAGHGASNAHWNGYGAGSQADYSNTGDLDLDQGFHLYALDWTPDGYTFSIDGVETWTAPNTPVTGANEYIILSSEVENGSWAGHIPTQGYGSYDDTQTNFQVDYVRVYGAESAVPEPATAGLLGLAGLAALVRRRRA